MKSGWMVRAGRSGVFFDDFEREKVVAIGWGLLGDLTKYKTQDGLYKAYISAYGNEKPSKTANAVAMLWKFVEGIKKGDLLISYSPERREYMVGEDLGEYQYKKDAIEEFSNLRNIKILGYVKRDALKTSTRNSLGATLTLFSLNSDVVQDVMTMLNKDEIPAVTLDEISEEIEVLKDTAVEQSLELIKDKINKLDSDEMEQLVASILRAMGFKAKVSPIGPDRNVDVFASPDGLGLTSPRIKAEVKHRNTAMGSKEIRSFIGALRDGDNGLFISTGGFTKDARYEAERANVPVTLINIDDLAHLIVSNYETFDVEGRALIPLVKIYWPVA